MEQERLNNAIQSYIITWKRSKITLYQLFPSTGGGVINHFPTLRILLIDRDQTSGSTNANKRPAVHPEKGKRTCKPLRQQWPYDLTAAPALAYQPLPAA